VCDYVHLNPARAKLVAPDTPLKCFAWSRWPAYLLAPSKRPAWLRADRVLGEWGIPKDSPAACLCVPHADRGGNGWSRRWKRGAGGGG